MAAGTWTAVRGGCAGVAKTACAISAVQNRCNIFSRRDFASGVVERCRVARIAYVAYSPVGGRNNHTRLLEDKTLVRIAAKHGTSPYVVALRWLLDSGENVIPIPGASKVASVRSSLSALDVTLDATDRAELDAL